jgi:hypothetical protein
MPNALRGRDAGDGSGAAISIEVDVAIHEIAGREENLLGRIANRK